MTPPPNSDAFSSSPLAEVAIGRRTRLRNALNQRIADSGIEHLNLRWRFRVVVLAFAFPFLAYIVWAATQQAMLEKTHAREEARANATLLAARFEDHVEQVDRLLATAAQAIGANIDDVAAIETLMQNMRSYVPKAVDNIAVWGLDGHNIAALDRRTTTHKVNVADRSYFTQTLARRDFSFEGPTLSRATGVQIVQFARPVFNTKNEVIAVITMSMRPAELIELLDPNAMITENALVTVFNSDGVIVARSADSSMWIGKRIDDLDALLVAFSKRSGTREEVDVDGERRLSGYAVVSKWPWIVTVGAPLEKIIGPISDRLLMNLAIGLAIFFVAFLIAGRVASWTVKPLMQLGADTDRFGRGDLSHRSAVVAGGEIATLAANFNPMAVAIEERDLQLKASRIQLRAIADNIPEQITYVDRDERYRFVNAYPGPFTNIAPEDMIGKTVREVRGEEVYQMILPMLLQALRGQTFSGEKSLIVDGRLQHFAVTYVPDIGVGGKVKGVYAFAQDITQRKTAELLRIESEKRLTTITDNLPAMICYVDGDRRHRFVNKAFEKWYEKPLSEIIGQPFDRLMPPAIAAQFDYYFLRGMQGEACEYELEIPSKSGSRWLKCNFIPDFDEETGVPRGVYGMVHNVTKAKHAEQRLTRLAQFDTLTGLANRLQFNETLTRVLNDQASHFKPLALMFLDIDHFKQVNDRLGHAGGDALLKEFALRLSDCVRPTDAVARLSGDEFVVLLEGMHSDEEPQFIARKIIATIEKPFFLDGVPLRVTASIGIAMRTLVDEAASELMKRADEALYEAKRNGRNTFRMAS
jgi:diguanylate cyclase (GGDEF)-like protein/PAS domain S-box-containing protein